MQKFLVNQLGNTLLGRYYDTDKYNWLHAHKTNINLLHHLSIKISKNTTNYDFSWQQDSAEDGYKTAIKWTRADIKEAFEAFIYTPYVTPENDNPEIWEHQVRITSSQKPTKKLHIKQGNVPFDWLNTRSLVQIKKLKLILTLITGVHVKMMTKSYKMSDNCIYLLAAQNVFGKKKKKKKPYHYCKSKCKKCFNYLIANLHYLVINN